MLIRISLEDKVCDILRAHPGVMEILVCFGISVDESCSESLFQVIDRKNINEGQLLTEINSYLNKIITLNRNEWYTMPLHKLVEYIAKNHHYYRHVEMPAISRLIGNLIEDDLTKKPEPILRLTNLFNQLEVALNMHLKKEEHVLFPLVKNMITDSSLRAQAVAILQEIEEEHLLIFSILKEMRTISNYYSTDGNLDNSYLLAYLKLQEFEAEINRHLRLESDYLFPRLVIPEL